MKLFESPLIEAFVARHVNYAENKGSLTALFVGAIANYLEDLKFLRRKKLGDWITTDCPNHKMENGLKLTHSDNARYRKYAFTYKVCSKLLYFSKPQVWHYWGNIVTNVYFQPSYLPKFASSSCEKPIAWTLIKLSCLLFRDLIGIRQAFVQ